MTRTLLHALICLAMSLAPGVAARTAPRVVASIPPLHSLVTGVMRGVGEPTLLMRASGSPHDHQLRPSDASALHRAELVFWIGPSLEGFLVRPLARLGDETRVVTLLDAAGLVLYPARAGGVWQMAPHAHVHAHAGTAASASDPHVWLDPHNAGVLVQAIATELAAIDPANAARYRANGAHLGGRLAALDESLAASLAPLRGRPFLVFHDAYQYLERRYGMHAVGAVSVDPGRPPGARRLSELRARLRDLDVRCVFREPQFEPTLLKTILEGTKAHQGVLDPLGFGLAPGPEAYFTLMQSNATSIRECLGGGETLDF